MKFLQSKKVRRILLFTGLLLMGAGAYVGYELYTINKAMDQLGEAMTVFAKVVDIFSSSQEALPDSTVVIDSTQPVADSLMIQ